MGIAARAALFFAPGEPLRVQEVMPAEPGPRDVVVRIRAVAICGSDLHVVKGEWPRPTPMVLGHEGAGVIELVGTEVAGLVGATCPLDDVSRAICASLVGAPGRAIVCP